MTDTKNTGAMIAFKIPKEIADQLHKLTVGTIPDYIEDANNMHVTLAFLGEAKDISDDQQSTLVSNLQSLVLSISSVTGTINGIGRFMDNNPNALYANFDAIGLPKLRELIIEAARKANITPILSHGFQPHVTIGYIPSNEPTPNIIIQESINFNLNAISLFLGDEIYTFNLTGETIISEQNMSDKNQTINESIVISDDGDVFDVGDVVTYINDEMTACLGVIRSVNDEIAAVEQLNVNLQPTGQVYNASLIGLKEYNILGFDDDNNESIVDNQDSNVDNVSDDNEELEELTSEDFNAWHDWGRVYGDVGWRLLSETVPSDAPKEDFAYTPTDNKSDWKLYIGDKVHAHEAAVAIGNSEYRGNKLDIPSDTIAGVKSKVSSAVRKYFTDGTQKYLLTWIKTGKKPEKKSDSISETKHKIVREISTPSFEFKGKPPEVPFAPGVDVIELTKNDPDPLYVIRPLAVLDGLSENNLRYNKALVDSIQGQVLSKRPPARLGHVSEEDASSLFPPEVGLWVGVKMVGNTLYGKCYTYPADGIFREMIRKRKAAGSGISNSIWGKGNFEEMSDGTQICSELELESIDFAPPERAALQSLGREFTTTAEMTDSKNNTKKVNEMGNFTDSPIGQEELDALKKHLSEMESSAVYEMMSETHKDYTMSNRVKETAPAKMYEMLTGEQKQHTYETRAKEMGTKANTEETKRFGEMQGEVAELKRTVREYQEREYQIKVDQEIDSRFTHWVVNAPENKAKLVDIKRNFKLAVIAQMASTKDRNDVSALVDGAWESQRTILEMAQVGLQGPSAIVTAIDNLKPESSIKWGNYDDKNSRKLSDPDEARRIRKEMQL